MSENKINKKKVSLKLKKKVDATEEPVEKTVVEETSQDYTDVEEETPKESNKNTKVDTNDADDEQDEQDELDKLNTDEPSANVYEDQDDYNDVEKYIGWVKWFNHTYGFITVTSDGDFKNQDVFVHQSYLRPRYSPYRTLYTGEYVQFVLGQADTTTDEAGNTVKPDYTHQAIYVTGVHGGPLRCDQQVISRRPANKSNGGYRENTSGRGRGRGGGRGRGRGYNSEHDSEHNQGGNRFSKNFSRREEQPNGGRFNGGRGGRFNGNRDEQQGGGRFNGGRGGYYNGQRNFRNDEQSNGNEGFTPVGRGGRFLKKQNNRFNDEQQNEE